MMRGSADIEDQRFRLIIETAGDLIFTVNKKGIFRYMSPNSGSILGYRQHELEGKNFEPFVHPDDAGWIKQNLHEIFDEYKKTGQPVLSRRVVEFRAVTAGGYWRWLSAKNAFLEEIDGECELALIARDITGHKEIEDRLRESEERFRKLFQNAPVGIFRSNEKGEMLQANSEMASLLGFDSEQEAAEYYTNLEVQLYKHPERRRQFIELIKEKGFVENFEFEAKTRHGSEILLSMNARLEQKDNSSGFIIEGFFTDLTERKKAEEENLKLQRRFHQVQKLESIGRLAGGVAHDLNNLLSPVLGYSELLLEETELGRSTREQIEEIANAGRRARALVGQLLAFSRKQALQFRSIDMNELLKNFEKLLRRTLRENITMNIHFAPGLPAVNGDPGQLEQVVMNLAINAQEAMPEGGDLTIETGTAELDENYAKQKRGVVPGSYVMLAVSDTGEGMDSDTREHLFEPFFTTREKHGGTGLGLATSYGIVKQHGGNIWVYSEPGLGTIFKIYLPVSAGEADESTEEVRPLISGKSTGTILIVEDEDQVRNLASTILKKKGYRVLEAQSGQEAVGLLENHSGRVDLLLTDVIMPDMNGRKVLEHVSRLHPDVRAVFMSGYTDDVIAHHGIIDRGVNFIQKPFSLKALAAKVEQALQGEK